MAIEPKPNTSASHWILAEYKIFLEKLNIAEQKYEFGHSIDLLYSFLWDKYAPWYLEYQKIDKSDLDFARSLYQDYVYRISAYTPFQAEVINTELFNKSDSIAAQKYNQEVFQKAIKNINIERVQEFQKVVNLIEDLRSQRGLFGIDPGTKLEIASTEPWVKSFAEYISLVAKTSIVEDKTNKPYQIKTRDFEYSMNILEFVNDKKAEIQRTYKITESLLKQIKSLESQLQSQNFVSKAPKKVIEEKKTMLEKNRLELSSQEAKIKLLETAAL